MIIIWIQFESQSKFNEIINFTGKDRITAGDGAKAHELKDKGRLSTQTNCAIFNYLNSIGVQTHFISEDKNNSSGFIAKECAMIPIEWVSRLVFFPNLYL